MIEQRDIDIMDGVLNIYSNNLDDHESMGWEEPNEVWDTWGRIKKLLTLREATS